MNSHVSFIFASLAASTLLLAGTIADKPLDASLVVYNSNLGLVHEKRNVALDAGPQALVYREVASSVVTESVNVAFAEGVTLHSQQYRFDQITAHKLAQAHLGKAVRFYLQTGSDLIYKSGTLLSAASDAVVKTADGAIYTIPASALIFSEIPDALITSPSLVWNIDAPKKSRSTLTMDYLINNISWRSNYVLNLGKQQADLTGWITVDNRSGKAFDNTALTLLAGDINRAAAPVDRRYLAKAALAETESDAVREIAHEGYHLYTIPFKVDLANNESTQIKFLDIRKIPVTRQYEAALNSPFYANGERKYAVTQSLEIIGLEKPLPMGLIRSYSKEKEQTLLLGESPISHTPKHEKIDVTLGKNFDLAVKETMFANNSDRYYNDATLQYEVTNRSEATKTIELLIPFTKRKDDESRVTTKQNYSWKNGNTLAFNVTVKADSKKSFEVHFRAKKQ